MANLEEVLAREGEMVITKHGKPIARLVPVAPRRAVPTNQDLRDSLPRLRKTAAEYLREDRDGDVRR